jgi:hypothetical protein
MSFSSIHTDYLLLRLIRDLSEFRGRPTKARINTFRHQLCLRSKRSEPIADASRSARISRVSGSRHTTSAPSNLPKTVSERSLSGNPPRVQLGAKPWGGKSRDDCEGQSRQRQPWFHWLVHSTRSAKKARHCPYTCRLTLEQSDFLLTKLDQSPIVSCRKLTPPSHQKIFAQHLSTSIVSNE